MLIIVMDKSDRAKIEELEGRIQGIESEFGRISDELAKIRLGDRPEAKMMKVPKRPKPLKDLNLGKDPEDG